MLSWRFLSWNLEAKKITGIKKPANKNVFLITKILDKSWIKNTEDRIQISLKGCLQKKKDA